MVWKRNRNTYARLLLEQLRCGTLAEPFTALPPDGPLPTLPKHLAYAFKPMLAMAPSSGARSGGSPSPSPSPRQQQQQQQQQRPGRQHSQGGGSGPIATATSITSSALTASEQLDAYLQLGSADLRQAEYAEEEEARFASAASAASTSGRGGSVGGVGAGRAAGSGNAPTALLPGTRMQLRGAEAQRVDRRQLEDVGWQPSKLELQAQLGASRERQAQLEWRLAAMEGLLRQQQQEQPLARPLGSLLDAMEAGSAAAAGILPTRAAQVGPCLPHPGQLACSLQTPSIWPTLLPVCPVHQLQDQAGGGSKLGVDALMERHAAKARQWQSPGWPTPASARRTPGGALARAAAAADVAPQPVISARCPPPAACACSLCVSLHSCWRVAEFKLICTAATAPCNAATRQRCWASWVGSSSRRRRSGNAWLAAATVTAGQGCPRPRQ